MKMDFKKIIMMGLLAVNVHGQDFVDVELGHTPHQSCQQVVEIVERDEQTMPVVAGLVEEGIELNEEEREQTSSLVRGGFLETCYTAFANNIQTVCLSVTGGLIVGVIMNEINQ